jgi:tRNA pseudouridine55 synthase
MQGIVNLDKPVGPTSHDMVGLMRRLTGTRRIGHAGTLDPLASGVLPILIGAATRFSEELTGGPKRYEAVIRLGWRSATDDGQGPLERGGQVPDRTVAEDAVRSFVGTYPQRPPTFSARKVSGTTAHRAARRGQPMDLPARTVTIESIDVLAAEPTADHLDLRVDVRCGPGTYVRSLARDLGDALGSGGYLAALRRTETAGLRVTDARTPVELERLAVRGELGTAITPIEELLPLARIELDDERGRQFRNGSRVACEPGGKEGRVAVFSGGRLIGVGMVTADGLQPDKVIVADEETG